MIFIFGGHGFVGSAFVRYCENNNLKYTIIDRQNYADLKHKECDLLINAAGNSDKILSKKNPILDFESNVSQVLQSILDFKFKKYILLSSCEVYPDCSNPSLTREETKIENKDQSTYGFHKYLGELIIKQITPNWLIFRLGGMVGKGLKKNPIFDITKRKTLFVDPKSKFQFLLTDEVAKIIFKILNKKINNEIFNLCGDGTVKLAELINKDNKIIIEDNCPILHYNVNIEKIKKIIEIPSSKETVSNFILSVSKNL